MNKEATLHLVSTNDIRLETLKKFYKKNPDHMETFIKIVTGSHEQKKLSLRIFDWTVTNFTKKNDITYKIKGKVELFNIHDEYRKQLKAFTKKGFDPFCRSDRILFHYKQDGKKKCIDTTIAQLNFFKWAILNGVVDYIIGHFDSIFEDMNEANRKQRKASEKYKKSLEESSNTKSIKIYETKNNSSEKYYIDPLITKPLDNVNILEFTSSKKKKKKHTRKTTRKPRQELSESSSKDISKYDERIIIDFN